MNAFEKEYLKILKESEDCKDCKETEETCTGTENCNQESEVKNTDDLNCGDGNVECEQDEDLNCDGEGNVACEHCDDCDDCDDCEDEGLRSEYPEDDDRLEYDENVVSPSEWLVDGVCVKCQDPNCDGSCKCPKCGSVNCIGNCDATEE